MKRKIAYTLIGILSVTNMTAQTSKWFKKARKAQVTLYAIQSKGDTLKAEGCFISDKGDFLTEYEPLEHAREAYIIDCNGTSSQVQYIIGVNSTYNIAKLRANIAKKTVYLSVDTLSKSGPVYVMPKAADENGSSCSNDTISKSETAGKYQYFELTAHANKEERGCPALNADGQLVAFVQPPYIIRYNSVNSALQARMGLELKFGALDANTSSMRNCLIKRLLPEDEGQAYTYLYLMNANAETKLPYVEDYIARFPTNASGYIMKAELLTQQQKYAEADAVYQLAQTKKTGKNDEILNSRAKSILKSYGQKSYESWSLEQAQKDATNAYSANPLPIYLETEANVLYAQKEYREAADKYLSIQKTSNRDAKYFANASLCMQMAGASMDTLLSLMDSAVVMYQRPYPTAANTYLYRRAQLLSQSNKIKEALADYDDFENIMFGQLNDQFYYEREQVAQKSNRYLGRALKDIQKCISLNGKEVEYYAEEAVIYIRANEMDEAIVACKQAIALDSTYADPYRLMGIAYREKGNLVEAKKQLLKAKELGDTLAESVLEKINQ